MPIPRKVSLRQMETLVQFVESHRDIGTGRSPAFPENLQRTRERWHSIAVKLNSMAEDIHKTPDQWRRYWIEFKAKTKAKGANSRRFMNTDGKSNKFVPLNRIEKRVLAMLNPGRVMGLPGVRVNSGNISSVADTETPTDPLMSVISQPSTSTTTVLLPSTPSPVPSDPGMKVEWLEEEVPSPLGSMTEVETSAPSITQDTQNEQRNVSASEDRPAERSAPQSRRSTSQRRSRRGSAERTAAQRRRSPSQKRSHRARRGDRVRHWAYEIACRRVAVEERHVAAIEKIATLIKDIRDDVRTYIHRTG